MLEVLRRRDGTVVLSLPPEHAAALTTLPARLRRLVADPDFTERAVARLFPTAYEDPEKEAEYRRLLGDDLRRKKLEGVAAFEATLHDARFHDDRVEIWITGEQFELWLGFVNDIRLVLGMELDIRDDDWTEDFDENHPRAEDLALLHYLSSLEECLLRAHGIGNLSEAE